MKKFVAFLVLTSLVLSSLALCVSANLSPTGKIVKASESNPTIVDANGNVVADVDTTGGPITELTQNDDDGAYVPDPNQFAEAFGETFSEFKLYGSFELRLTDFGKKVVGDGKLAGVEITLNIPGMTAANNPTVFYFDVEKNIYQVIEDIKVDGSNITFKAMPLTAAKSTAAATYANALTVSLTSAEQAEVSDTDIGHYGVLYTGTITSPSTGVPTAAFVIVLVVALAGAAFAGKKIFSK